MLERIIKRTAVVLATGSVVLFASAGVSWAGYTPRPAFCKKIPVAKRLHNPKMNQCFPTWRHSPNYGSVYCIPENMEPCIRYYSSRR